MTEKVLLSVRETLSILGISRQLFYNLANRGELPTLKIGNSRKVSRRSLEEYIERLERDAKPDAS